MQLRYTLAAAAAAHALVLVCGCTAARPTARVADDCTRPFAATAPRPAGGTGLSLLTPAERALPVAEVGGRVITLGAYQAELDHHLPERRARYATDEARRELLDQLVRFELLALAAYRRGYASDPGVSRATKEALVRTLLAGDLDPASASTEIPERDVEWYYEEHKDELRRPAEARASVIVLADRDAAEAVRAAASAPDLDDAAWRALVEKHSADPASRERAGDLGWFARSEEGGPVDPAVSAAAFALAAPGDVAPIVEAGAGLCVVRLTDRREGYEPPFAEVRDAIVLRLLRERRTRAFGAYLAALEVEAGIKVFPENLAKAKVVLEAGARAPGRGPGRGAVPGAGSGEGAGEAGLLESPGTLH